MYKNSCHYQTQHIIRNLELEKRLAKIRNEIPNKSKLIATKVDVSTQTKLLRSLLKEDLKKF